MPSSPSSPPPPRRKSCSECAKAKRRCDLGIPICSRCTKQNLDCIYARLPAVRRTFRAPSDPANSCRAGSTPGFTVWSTDEAPVYTVPEHVEDLVLGDDLDATLGLETTLFDYQGKSINALTWQPEECGISKPVQLLPHLTSTESPLRPTYRQEDYQKLEKICDDFTHEDLTDPFSTISYALSSFKNFHRSMAQNYQTPFLHRRLYKEALPPIIVDAFTSCVLYANKTPANEAVVFQVMDSNVERLLGLGYQQPVTLLEALARVQALLLYQTMRCFDEDIRQRANAEAAMPILEAWTLCLSALRDDCDVMADENGAVDMLQAPRPWESWICGESVRRTIVIVNYFICLYSLLKSGGCSIGPWASAHFWTLSRHLWEAPNSFDFLCAWQQKPHHKISNVFFEDFLKIGSGDDVDDFGRILLVTYMGMDDARQWFQETGSKF